MSAKAKKLKQKQSAEHPVGAYVAVVPVTIQIGEGGHKGKILKEYDDVIDVEFTDVSPEGRKHIGMFLFFAREKGLSTEEAIFTIASEAVKEETVRIVSQFTFPTSHELHLHVKRNGDIT